MKTISKIIAITAFAITATAAQAQIYGEVGYTALKLKGTSGGTTLEASPSALGATIGYEVHENVAVEAMGIFGISDDTVKGTSIAAKAKINSSYGLFVKPKTMLGENFEIFGRLGYMNSKATVSGAGFSSSTTGSSFAYGLGANYYVSKTTYLTVNYMNLYNKDSVKIDGLTFGLGMKF